MLLWVLADFQPKIQKIVAHSYNFNEVTIKFCLFWPLSKRGLFSSFSQVKGMQCISEIWIT